MENMLREPKAVRVPEHPQDKLGFKKSEQNKPMELERNYNRENLPCLIPAVESWTVQRDDKQRFRALLPNGTAVGSVMILRCDQIQQRKRQLDSTGDPCLMTSHLPTFWSYDGPLQSYLQFSSVVLTTATRSPQLSKYILSTWSCVCDFWWFFAGFRHLFLVSGKNNPLIHWRKWVCWMPAAFTVARKVIKLQSGADPLNDYHSLWS